MIAKELDPANEFTCRFALPGVGTSTTVAAAWLHFFSANSGQLVVEYRGPKVSTNNQGELLGIWKGPLGGETPRDSQASAPTGTSGIWVSFSPDTDASGKPVSLRPVEVSLELVAK
jgi:hypothetical protein